MERGGSTIGCRGSVSGVAQACSTICSNCRTGFPSVYVPDSIPSSITSLQAESSSARRCLNIRWLPALHRRGAVGHAGALLSPLHLQRHALAGGTNNDDPAQDKLAQARQHPLCPGDGAADGVAHGDHVAGLKRSLAFLLRKLSFDCSTQMYMLGLYLLPQSVDHRLNAPMDSMRRFGRDDKQRYSLASAWLCYPYGVAAQFLT